MKDLIRNDPRQERVNFTLPEVNRDQQISLGQSIIALIGINLPEYFSDQDNKEDIGLMLIDIAKHFQISIEDLYRFDVLENVLDPDFEYQIKTELSYSVISKKEL